MKLDLNISVKNVLQVRVTTTISSQKVKTPHNQNQECGSSVI